jgi:hypothetical protein
MVVIDFEAARVLTVSSPTLAVVTIAASTTTTANLRSLAALCALDG